MADLTQKRELWFENLNIKHNLILKHPRIGLKYLKLVHHNLIIRATPSTSIR